MTPSPLSQPTSRRDFVKETAAAGVAASVGLSLAHTAHAAGSDVIRIGVIGCGGRGTGAAGDAMTADPAVRLVAMCDLFKDRVESSRSLLKAEKPAQVQVDDDHCFVGLDGYKKVIDSVDYVLIACAAKFHAMYLQAGIEAGKHVFVEKPHAIDPLGIKVVKEATVLAKQKNVGILSGLMSRFAPPIRETVKRVQDGQIGEITTIEENFIRGPYGSINRAPNIRELEQQYANQYRFSWLCGDDVVQSLVHNLDRATWTLKETPPVRCHGLGGRSGPQNLLGDVFDHHSVVYQYANGIRLYAFCRTTHNCYNEDSSIIIGTKGVAHPEVGPYHRPEAVALHRPEREPLCDRAPGVHQIDPRRVPAQLRRLRGAQHAGGDHGSALVLQRPGSDLGRGEPVGVLLLAPARCLHLEHGPANQARRPGCLPGLCRAWHHQDPLTSMTACPAPESEPGLSVSCAVPASEGR